MNHRLAFRFLLLIALLAVALIVATRGWDYHPLDVHETYVVRTANEMVRHHEWFVPYFNDELRLNKPPLGYWASRVMASLWGSPELIKIWACACCIGFRRRRHIPTNGINAQAGGRCNGRINSRRNCA